MSNIKISDPIAYLDSSVLLRIILAEPQPHLDISRYHKLFSSRLLGIECRRVIHRLLLERSIDETFAASVQQRLRFALNGVHLIALSERLSAAAEGAFPLPLGTLDALHLTSALAIRDDLKCNDFTLLTHDMQLGRCAQAMGLNVAGLPRQE